MLALALKFICRWIYARYMSEILDIKSKIIIILRRKSQIFKSSLGEESWTFSLKAHKYTVIAMMKKQIFGLLESRHKIN